MLSPIFTFFKFLNARYTCASRTALPISPGIVPSLYHPTVFDVRGTAIAPVESTPTYCTDAARLMEGMTSPDGYPATASRAAVAVSAVAGMDDKNNPHANKKAAINFTLQMYQVHPFFERARVGHF